MITAEYCQLMARYNTWQNRSLVLAASRLSDGERWRDRGAFFRSIAETLDHLYWADILQVRRLGGDERPHETLDISPGKPRKWSAFKRLRTTLDAEIETWASGLQAADLSGVVRWYPPRGGTGIEKPGSLCVVQLFNHQTHHRGQVHAMLTAAGVEPEPTDLAAMAE